MNNPTVSIVIVCMNNLKNLYPCLYTIKKYTTVDYEIFVVAYLFSQENLSKVKIDFPWVAFIESNEIRGFSENNNLALRQAKGKYCFVVNDDTEMKMPVIDMLVEDFDKVRENVAIISPKTFYADGSVQTCGRGKSPLFNIFLSLFGLGKFYKRLNRKYVNRNGLFKSWNITGAAFLIKTDLFRKISWFDEKFFFCPEDIVVSETLNSLGYECWVDADVKLTHNEGMSAKGTSMMITATKPAHRAGNIIRYSQGKWWKEMYVRPILGLQALEQYVFHAIKKNVKNNETERILMISYAHSVYACISFKTPKQIFIMYYNKIKL